MAAPRHSFPPPVEEIPKPKLVPCYLCGTPVPPTNRFSPDAFAICPRQDNLACLDRAAAPPVAKTVRAARSAPKSTKEGA